MRKFTEEQIQKAKQVSIITYLQNRGQAIAYDRGGYVLMSSPLREDSKPSFKVDKELNHWIDFGTGEDGDVVELMTRLENITFVEAVYKLLGKQFPEQELKSSEGYQESLKSSSSVLKLHAVKPLGNNQALSDYVVQERKIPLDLAKLYLEEVYYYAPGKDKPYFSVGWKNDKDGYELRNSLMKNNLGEKSVSIIPRGMSQTILVFEGMFDFLSAMAYNAQEYPSYPALILNSLSLKEYSMNYISMFHRANLFLDHDEAGQKATRWITEHHREYQSKSFDCSYIYKGYKDLNAFWLAKSAESALSV